ncbi:MAG: protein kinase [Myxococcota bacterium]
MTTPTPAGEAPLSLSGNPDAAGSQTVMGDVDARLRILRQKNDRIPAEIRVTRYDGKPTYWQSVNLSPGGGFVQGSPILTRGTELEVGLWLPNVNNPQNDHEIITRARVAWTNDSLNPRAESLPPGMGLQFLDLGLQDQQAVEDYLAVNAAQIIDQEDVVEISAIEPDVKPEVEENLQPGSMLGVYRICRLLGSGGMGNVYVAEHTQLGRKVALKRLHARFASDPSIVKRFFDEARVVNQINHENIVEITDFISQDDNQFFVMEMLEGKNLADLHARGGVLPLHRALRIARQLCDALYAAHQKGIVHRDLKPENIMLIERNGTTDFVKLLDFGIAKLTENVGSAKDVSEMEHTQAGVILGTPGYIAPEQVIKGYTDHRSDIYALGVLLYQMVTGEKPFQADSWPELLHKHAVEKPPKPSRVAPGTLPQDLEALILECLSKSPDKRPQSTAEIGRRLQSVEQTYARTEPRGVQRPAMMRASAPKTHIRSIVAAAIATPVFVLGIVSALMLMAFDGDTPRNTLPPEAVIEVELGEAQAPPPTPIENARTLEQPSLQATDEPTREVRSREQRPRPQSVKTRAVRVDHAAAAAVGRTENRRGNSSEEARDAGGAQSGLEFRMRVVSQLIVQGEYQQAVKISRDILRSNPRYALAYRNLGIAYSGLNVRDQACESYRRYLRFSHHAADRAQVEEILRSCDPL